MLLLDGPTSKCLEGEDICPNIFETSNFLHNSTSVNWDIFAQFHFHVCFANLSILLSFLAPSDVKSGFMNLYSKKKKKTLRTLYCFLLEQAFYYSLWIETLKANVISMFLIRDHYNLDYQRFLYVFNECAQLQASDNPLGYLALCSK